MNLVTLITGIVIVMAVIEQLLHGMPRMKRDLFYLSMLVSWVGFTSKYYYGPDIVIYTLLYDVYGNVWDVLSGNYAGGYEIGYVFFTSLSNSLGISFWGMTAIISTLFFLSVFTVLRRLRDKRVLALALVLILLKDLIFAQFRQCLAVSFFTFAIIEAEGWRTSGYTGKKDLISALILGVIAMTMHKSAVFIVPLTALYYAMQPLVMRKNTWSVLLVMLMMLVVIPTWSIIEKITGLMNLSEMTMDSIRMHFSFMNLRQTNLLIYGMVLVVLTQYALKSERKSAILATVSAGMIIIVVLYQYYFMVDRLRAYFALPVIYYVFNTVRDASERRMPYVNLVRQTCELFLLLFLMAKAYSFDKHSRIEQGNLLEASTVFDLINEDAATVQARQMEKARKFWDSDQRADTRFMIPGAKLTKGPQ